MDEGNKAQIATSLLNLAKDAESLTGTAEGFIHVQMQRLDNDAVSMRSLISQLRGRLIETERLLVEVERARTVLEKAMEALPREPQ